MGWWRPFKQEDAAFLKELIESGSVAPILNWCSHEAAEIPSWVHQPTVR